MSYIRRGLSRVQGRARDALQKLVRLTQTVVVAAPLLFAGFPAFASENYTELLLFPSAHANFVETNELNPSHDSNEPYNLAADVFFALKFDKTRLLTEILFSTDEIELERVQLGLEISPKHFLWIGRFHSPLDYWNSQYSHAAFLQGSVHRPGIVDYEDHGGFLPAHAAGLMFEGEQLFQGQALEYNILFGSGMTIDHHGLSVIPLVDDPDLEQSFNVFTRLAYRPDDTSMTQYGVFAVYTDYFTDPEIADDIQQLVSGAYVHKTWMDFRVTSAGFLVDNKLTTNSRAAHTNFVAGYVHIDHEITSRWLAYSRYEDSYGTREDGYLVLFPEFAQRRGVFGARYDVNAHHAISVEAAALQLAAGVSRVFTLQWSAVYP